MITVIDKYRLMNESFINLFNDDMYKYKDEVWDILQTSYKSIGGFLSADSVEDLINKSWLWKLVRKENRIVTAIIYKNDKGRKLIGGGSDGSDIGKQMLFKVLQDDIKLVDRKMWTEVSGALENKMLKFGGIPIPNIKAKELLNKEIISLNDDGYHYTRLIAGVLKEKMIIGNI
jgi:hypothetical protein